MTTPTRPADARHKVAIIKAAVDALHEIYWAGGMDADEFFERLDGLMDTIRGIREVTG